MLRITEGHTRVSGAPRWVAPAVLPDGASAITNNAGILDVIDSLELDYRENLSGTNLHAATQSGSAPRNVRADRIIVRNSGLGARMADIFASGSGAGGDARWVVLDVVLDEAPVNYWIASGSDSESKITWRTFNHASSSALYERQDAQVASAAAPFVGRTPLPVVYLRAAATSNVSRTLGSLPNGAFPGQMLVVSWANASGSASLTVPNGGSSNITTGTGAALVVAPGKAVTLIWDGTTWRPTTLL